MEKSKRHVIKYTALVLLILILCGGVFTISYIMNIDEWRNFEPTDVANMQKSLRLLDKEGVSYTMLSGTERRSYVTIGEIPEHVKNAFIAIEDARFYSHGGVDFVRIMGALVEDIKTGGIKQGGSTISQQLVKTATLVSTQNVTRKFAEIMMAFKLEQEFSKDEILELYLNLIYFGRGAYGVETAARAYFSKSCGELTIAEGAMLAGILKSPTNYAPHLDMQKSIYRRDTVLAQMLENGFISREQFDEAKASPVIISGDNSDEYPYGYFTDAALYEACDVMGISMTELLTGGYTIKTTLDRRIQSKLESLAAVSDNLPPDAADGERAECAAVVLNTSAEVAAMIGGREHTARLALNRATAMRRQPGSTIKPIMVFAPALEYAGYTPTSFILDQPENFAGYAPRNSGSRYRGWVTLRDVVAYSINVPAVRLLNEITVARGKNYAASVGIPFEALDKNLSLSLGGFTTGITPMELCASYLPFASGGDYRKPSCIINISNSSGEIVYERNQPVYSVLSEETSYLVSSMLQSSVEYGTATELKLANMPLAAKTGTSSYDDAQNNKDAWTIAYNSNYIACSWMGFDKTDDSHSLPQGVTGGTYPARFIAELFKSIYSGQNAPEFERPEGVLELNIDGLVLKQNFEAVLASPYTPSEEIVKEVYSYSTAPTQYAKYVFPVSPSDFRVTRVSETAAIVSFTSMEDMEYKLIRTVNGESSEFPLIVGTGERIMITDDYAQMGVQCIYTLKPTVAKTALSVPNAYVAPVTYIFGG